MPHSFGRFKQAILAASDLGSGNRRDRGRLSKSHIFVASLYKLARQDRAELHSTWCGDMHVHSCHGTNGMEESTLVDAACANGQIQLRNLPDAYVRSLHLFRPVSSCRQTYAWRAYFVHFRNFDRCIVRGRHCKPVFGARESLSAQQLGLTPEACLGQLPQDDGTRLVKPVKSLDLRTTDNRAHNKSV